jgi:hypothetical protein
MSSRKKGSRSKNASSAFFIDPFSRVRILTVSPLRAGRPTGGSPFQCYYPRGHTAVRGSGGKGETRTPPPVTTL